MQQPSAVHATFVIERSFSKPPAQVFAALADPARKRRWFGEGNGHEVEVFHSDFRVGGVERLQYRLNESTPFPGVLLTNEGLYQDILPDRRVVTVSAMSLSEKRISVSLVTLELLATEQGTDLVCTHQGTFFEGADGPQRREAGWRKLLDKFDTELARA